MRGLLSEKFRVRFLAVTSNPCFDVFPFREVLSRCIFKYPYNGVLITKGRLNKRAVGLRFVTVMCTVTSYRCKIRTFTFNGGPFPLQGTYNGLLNEYYLHSSLKYGLLFALFLFSLRKGGFNKHWKWVLFFLRENVYYGTLYFFTE